jgi:hypothetical protein
MQMTSSHSRESLHEPVFAVLEAEATALRAAVKTMREREQRLMELLHTSVPEKIEHDLRNVLNELVLLRTLLQPQAGG